MGILAHSDVVVYDASDVGMDGEEALATWTGIDFADVFGAIGGISYLESLEPTLVIFLVLHFWEKEFL